MNAESAILEAGKVTRRFGGLTAVDSVDISVRAGTVHGLMGPNGAGKTTLVNMLTGVEKVDSGIVRFEGKDVTMVRPSLLAKRGIARTFQTSQLFEDESVLGNVMAGRHQHIEYGFPDTFIYTPRTARAERLHRTRCLELLDDVDMAQFAHTQVSALPYGRRRLVELARALATEPRLLVLDEPAAGLPGSDADVLGDLLMRLAGRGYTVLVIEHNIGLLMSICQSVTVLAEGKVIATGTPSKIKEDPIVIEAYLGSVEI